MDVPVEDLLPWGAWGLLAAGAVFTIVKPRVAWDLRQLFVVWQYRQDGPAPEPSRAGLWWTRASGVVALILLGIFLVLRLAVWLL